MSGSEELNDEEWSDIIGYEGKYKISNAGRVYSRHKKGILSSQVGNSGYEIIHLYRGGVRKVHLVHRLVARAFCVGYEEGLQVHHEDADRLNNYSANLRWVTGRENIRDSVSRGTYAVKKKKIAQISMDGEVIKVFNSGREAAESLGKVSRESHISRCANGWRDTAFGFRWEHVT